MLTLVLLINWVINSKQMLFWSFEIGTPPWIVDICKFPNNIYQNISSTMVISSLTQPSFFLDNIVSWASTCPRDIKPWHVLIILHKFKESLHAWTASLAPFTSQCFKIFKKVQFRKSNCLPQWINSTYCWNSNLHY